MISQINQVCIVSVSFHLESGQVWPIAIIKFEQSSFGINCLLKTFAVRTNVWAQREAQEGKGLKLKKKKCQKIDPKLKFSRRRVSGSLKFANFGVPDYTACFNMHTLPFQGL